jgi:hypothetical protein
LPCGRHILPLLLTDRPVIGQGVLLSRSLSRIRTTAALAALAIAVTGCAAANNATSSQEEKPHQTVYGLSSAGTTTSLYDELFGSKPAAAPATAVAAAEPGQPAPAINQPAAGQQARSAVTTANRQTKPATAQATATQVQPAPTPVAQQAAAPATEQADTPVAYGITANGPTTNLFTELFGGKRGDGQ